MLRVHYKEAKRVYKLDKYLLEQKVIGLQEFKQAENNYNYQLKRMNLTDKILKQDAESNAQQVSQAQQSYKGSQNALDVMRKKVGDLIVRAPVDGQLLHLMQRSARIKTKENDWDRSMLLMDIK